MKYSVFAFVIFLSGLILLIPNSYGLTPFVPTADYDEQKLLQQDYLWHLGKNLSVGDSYTYKICDPKTIPTSAADYHYFVQGNEDHNSSTCYTIKLDFVNLLTSDENHINERDVWVVQAAIDTKQDDNELRYSVFHIDTLTFEATSADTIHPDTKKYTDSLQKTLFSLFKYTAPEPQLLQIGEDWGEVTEALREQGENPHMIVISDNQEFSVIQNHIRMIDKQNIPITRDITDAFQVGYEIDIFDSFVLSDDKEKIIKEEYNNNVTTFFLILPNLPFPLSAESYNPVYVTQPQKQFEFKLISFMTNNKNIDFGKSVIDEPKDDDLDLSIKEIGTIELRFPQDDDIISEEDEIETVPEDVVDDVTEEDDKELPDDGQEVISDDDVKNVSNNDGIDNIQNDDVIVNDNNKVDYSKIVGLAVLLIVMIAGFVIFKKFKDSGFKNGLQKTLQKKPQHAVKRTIFFDDTLHIDIKTVSDEI